MRRLSFSLILWGFSDWLALFIMLVFVWISSCWKVLILFNSNWISISFIGLFIRFVYGLTWTYLFIVVFSIIFSSWGIRVRSPFIFHCLSIIIVFSIIGPMIISTIIMSSLSASFSASTFSISIIPAIFVSRSPNFGLIS